MKILTALFASGLAAAVGAQTNTLLVNPASGIGLTYSNPGANFFDLVVNIPVVTLRALQIPCQEPAGTVGRIELWRNTLSMTHIGTEQPAGGAPTPSGSASGWQLVTDGAYTSAGFAVNSQTCQSAFTVNVPNTELTAGTYAFAIVYVDINHQFEGVTTYPAPAGTFSDGSIEVRNGTTQATAWTAAPLTAFTFNGVAYQGTIPDFGITYDIGSVPHSCGEVDVFGEGSVKRTASLYNLSFDAAPTSTLLQGNSLVLTYTPDSYVVSCGGGTFRPNSGLEQALPAVDDGENQITLPNLTFLVPTDDGIPPAVGLSDVWVHSNGYVSTAPQSPLFFVPVDPQAAMDADAFAWFVAYHDFNPLEMGSGQIIWEEALNPGAPWLNPTLFITWDDVESYPANVVNTSRVQLQVDLVTNNVTYVWDAIDPVGGSTFAGGDDTLIGWSPAGVSPVTAPFTYPCPGPFVAQLPEIFPLQLDVTGSVLLGGSFTLDTTNLALAGAMLPSIGVNLVSPVLAFPVPGFPLSTLGAPVGSNTYLDVSLSILNVISNGGAGTATLGPVNIPNSPSLAGAEFYSQSFWWSDVVSFIGGNLFGGLLTSNGVRITVGGF